MTQGTNHRFDILLAILCPPLPTWNEQSFSAHARAWHSVVEYTCNTGFRFTDGAQKKTTTCSSLGKWIPTIEDCTGDEKSRHRFLFDSFVLDQSMDIHFKRQVLIKSDKLHGYHFITLLKVVLACALKVHSRNSNAVSSGGNTLK